VRARAIAKQLNDADLAILAARPKRYDRYSVAIRAEYGHLDDDAYRAGRRGVLESFLARGSIYGTEQMVNRCDAAARLNLSRELAAIGRNLNQIARAANDGGRLPGSAREEFRAMLKVCEALRDNTKALLKANLTSWESGHGEDV